MKARRFVSAKKKDVHLTILVDSSLDDFQKVIKKIRTEVAKHNHRPESKAKVSFDIIYAEDLERRASRSKKRRLIKSNFCEEDDAVGIRYSK